MQLWLNLLPQSLQPSHFHFGVAAVIEVMEVMVIWTVLIAGIMPEEYYLFSRTGTITPRSCVGLDLQGDGWGCLMV